MRKIIDFLISIYLLPLRLSKRLALYTKGRILPYQEHYVVALDVIRRNFPNDNGIVVDVGAYDGDSTIFFAENLKNKIIGFEPNPVPFEKAKKNTAKYSNVEVENLGLSDKIGEVDFHVTTNSVSSSLFQIKDFSEISPDKIIKIPATTLDNYFEVHKEILLIKLDVQGAELNILRGAKETLKKTKLILTEVSITEFYHGACLYFDLDGFLRANHFKIHTIITNYNNDGVKYFDILYIKSRQLRQNME